MKCVTQLWVNENILQSFKSESAPCIKFTSSHLHIINGVKDMCIWHAVRGEGSELGISPDTERSPPSASARAGVATGWRWGVGVVEGCWTTRNDEVIIYKDSLSYLWIDGVITDYEMTLLIIHACSSRNVLIKHHLLSLKRMSRLWIIETSRFWANRLGVVVQVR